MNNLFIIGNLTSDPESRSTQSGKQVSTFTVAVNRRGTEGADYFRVSAWSKLGELCQQYLKKGRKVAVTGSIRAGAYTNSEGKAVGTLEVMADEIEFLSPKDSESQYQQEERKAIQQEQTSMVRNNGGFIQVNNEELPF